MNWNPTGAWKVTGAIEYNNFGNIVRRYTLNEILEKPSFIPWRDKNGKQRVHICALDHGTHRIWMSPKHSVL